MGGNYRGIFNIVACFFVMMGCLFGLSEEVGAATSSQYYMLSGLGVMLSCFNMLRYFEVNKRFYLHVETLRNASAHILRFLVSVSPIYWGYAIFGVLNFGPYTWKFESLDQASVTLFALLTGDDIHDTFRDIVDQSYPFPWVSRIYIYSFVTLFITTVLNVFIFIIEDAFLIAKINLGIYTSSAEVEGMELSSLEGLKIIFQNLDVWKERMEKHRALVPKSSLIHDHVPLTSSSSSVTSSKRIASFDSFAGLFSLSHLFPLYLTSNLFLFRIIVYTS